MTTKDLFRLKPRSGSEADRRAFVEQLYLEILQREGEPAGIEAQAELLAGAISPKGLIEAFLSCPEYVNGVGIEVAAREAAAAAADAERRANLFPLDYEPAGESWRSYQDRVRSGFFDLYCSGHVVLDIGYSGYDNPEGKTAFPHAIGIDFDTPGYDGLRLPYADGTVDTVFSSHALEHFDDQIAAIREWYRVLKVGGFIVCMVPSQALYEKKRDLPSNWNGDHKRMYSPASLAAAFEEALEVNSFRLRHLRENDADFDYSRGPDLHSNGSYEIEIVVEKIDPPTWSLA